MHSSSLLTTLPGILTALPGLLTMSQFPLAAALHPAACQPAPSFAANLSYIGCYTDTSRDRALADSFVLIRENSVDVCSDLCGRLGYKYAGVEFGRQCLCGGEIASDARQVDESECDMVCPGDSSATCGQSERVNIWEIVNVDDRPDLPLFPDCTTDPLCSNAVCDTSLPHHLRAHALISLFNLTEKLNNYVNTAPGVPRLGLRPYEWWNEALHGLADSPGSRFADEGEFSYSTSFPQPIVVASAFDDDMVERIGQTIATEVRAFHNAGRSGITLYTPNVNTFRDPRWGRGMETPGEDPFHAQGYAAAILSGLEDKSTGYKKTIATCKHYAANDFEAWGLDTRHNFDAPITLQELNEYYLAPFKTCAVDLNVGSFMCSYNAVNGHPLCANRFLLNDVLRGHWAWTNYTNFVTSDCDAIRNIHDDHHYVETDAEAAAVALKAGTDLQCNAGPGADSITAAYEQGLVTEGELDTALVRLWGSLVSLGIFDPADQQPLRSLGWEAVNTPEAQQLAYDAAVAGSVLIKNDDFLPLDAAKETVYAFVGPGVNATAQMQGIYSGPAPYVITPHAAAAERQLNFSFHLGSRVNGTDCSFDAAIRAAQDADVVVFMGGIDDSMERENNDRTSLDWPVPQIQLLRALVELDKPIIIVQFGGGQLDDTAWLASDNVKAILWSGYPGQSGGTAILDIIFGDAAPAGRLPVTQYPASYFDQVPPTDMNLRPAEGNNYLGRTHMWYTGDAPVPFGHGLHYTDFNVTMERIIPPPIDLETDQLLASHGFHARDTDWNEVLSSIVLEFAVNVTNVGSVKSDYVVLLFMRSNAGPEPRPLKTIASYRRLNGIEPGEQRSLVLPVTFERMVRVDWGGNKLLYPGNFTFWVDLDEKATAQVRLGAHRLNPDTML
ncbi:glycosyl hydrolase family 3 N terminal domain-containing protein [Stachybotrys elegans]|uniref:xylan 1,4-beta-xylosidase n=1 Tax=Stachybotrys elegans TaxID=80388 RepID=A0A8K0WJU4_9HYPO|nr:glycosyl hydrolase family 3 N terminal domain-containing protein [Stachybotrys elegans]